MKNPNRLVKVCPGTYWYHGIHIIWSGKFWEMFESGRLVGMCYKLWGCQDMIDIGAYHLPAGR
jgi:hypothetical protein